MKKFQRLDVGIFLPHILDVAFLSNANFLPSYFREVWLGMMSKLTHHMQIISCACVQFSSTKYNYKI